MRTPSANRLAGFLSCAIKQLSKVLRLRRDHPHRPEVRERVNGWAWLWTTCPDKTHRDGKKAVESATCACELGEWKEANLLGTLAAACAEAGDFEKAVEWQEKANTLYTDADERKEGEERLGLYKEKKPYRDEG